MFHLCCLGISNSKGSKRRETAGGYTGGRRGNQVTLSFSLCFSICASFAAVFKIRHLNKRALMASGQEKKGTTWLLWRFYLMSSKPLALTCSSFITLLWRDICDKSERREPENEAECSYCGSRLAFAVIFVIYSSVSIHIGFSGECCPALTEKKHLGR